MEGFFDFQDDMGPIKVIHVHEPAVGLAGVLVVDNVACGPSIGGMRVAPDVTTEECFRLARAMTLKNAAAGLAHGGGKSVVRADPRMPLHDKERLVRTFAAALRREEDYIFGPDMGSDELCMAWVKDEIGRAVGLPREVGGIPLDELGATGWGLSYAAQIGVKYCDFELTGARVAVQGFGAVGMHAARFLEANGAVLVAAADSQCTLYDPSGLNVQALMKLKQAGTSLREYPKGEKLDAQAVIGVECDIWIPAARPDVIRRENVDQLKTKLILQGANIPITAEAEAALHHRGVLSVPDFIANAGGVICAAMEYRGATQRAAFDAIAEKVHDNTSQVLARVRSGGVTPRQAAVDLATTRLRDAMATRRHHLF